MPGSRRRRNPWTEPQYGPNRWAWLVIGTIEIVLYSGMDRSEYSKGDENEEQIPSYTDGLGISPLRLSIRRIGHRPLTLNLTYYTVKELEAMKALIIRAFDTAIERSAILDAEAYERSIHGDDSIPRVYRPDPQIIERPGVLTRTTRPDMVEPEPDAEREDHTDHEPGADHQD